MIVPFDPVSFAIGAASVSGGGGSGGGGLVVTYTVTDAGTEDEVITASNTLEEIFAELDAGGMVSAKLVVDDNYPEYLSLIYEEDDRTGVNFCSLDCNTNQDNTSITGFWYSWIGHNTEDIRYVYDARWETPSDTFVVHLTNGDEYNETVENASEIIAAYESGKSMLCDWPGFYYIEVYTTATGKALEMSMMSVPESANNSIEIVKYYGSLSEAGGYDKPFELSGEEHYTVALTPDS